MPRNILLGVTGSVAAVLTGKLVRALKEIGDVRVVFTKCGKYFVEKNIKAKLAWEAVLAEGLLKGNEIFTDEDEWPESYEVGDPVVHIELRKWASCFVIAPLSANTLAKIEHGICDNLLTSVFRAWDWTRPIILAPAMNTMMWENNTTHLQMYDCKQKGCLVVDPVSKTLACGDEGSGAMASIDDIAKIVRNRLRWQFPLLQCSGVPVNYHPGAFGFHRRKNHHTGVDLYTNDGALVRAVEDGIVVNVDDFTGPKVGDSWWNDTQAVQVEGSSGVVTYGEITPFPDVCVGKRVRRGDPFARVKRVLLEGKERPDIPGHSPSMLHIELYKHGSREFAGWRHEVSKNPLLLDPTPYLLDAEGAPATTLLWENPENKPVG
jgi:phosphopantothenoylcysteine decarboxylase